MMRRVRLDPAAQRAFDRYRIPPHIEVKLLAWVELVQADGLEEARKVPGYHDEPVAARPGVRSIRLSRSYRAFYTVRREGGEEVVVVEEVNKHDYRRRG